MAHVTLSLEEYEALRASHEWNPTPPESLAPAPKKKKRKVSKYSQEFGRQLKALKKKHPRSKIGSLMSQAHVKTRKAMK